jgi:hypothetical protein
MALKSNIQKRAFRMLRAAVDHQGKLWDITLELAKLRDLEQDQVVALVQAQSTTADTGRDLTEEDFLDYLALEPAPSGLDQKKAGSNQYLTQSLEV